MYILPLGQTIQTETQSFGGKADALTRLIRDGHPVPGGYAIASQAFRDGKILEDARDELKGCIASLSDQKTYAVRSSAVGEDGETTSFAGMYETVLDVKKEALYEAIHRVAASAKSERLLVYAEQQNIASGSVGVIIQEYIPADYAGVLFTSDVLSGSAARMIGNYVRGMGEKLVSGEANAESFTIHTLKYRYEGESEFDPHAKKLCRRAVRIKRLFGQPMDIEWLVTKGKLYILQARPITTLQGRDEDCYRINDTLSGEYLFSKTNVGEIFMRPLSPMTHGILSEIFEMLGIPIIANVYGQAYFNVSGMCSLLVAFGFSRKKAYTMISDIAGTLPENAEIPIYPYEKRILIKKLWTLLFAPKKKADFGVRKKDFPQNISVIADGLIDQVREIEEKEALYNFWKKTCDAFMTKVLSTILSSLSLKSLFQTREKLTKRVGETLANELCSNCSLNGTIESLKPLLLLENVINGTLEKEEYRRLYGHRHANEMELACPYPYEDPAFPDALLEEYRQFDVRAGELKRTQEEKYRAAIAEFKRRYPSKAKWLDKNLSDFAKANLSREDVRSQSVKLFCLMREFLLKSAKLLNLGDDIFLLHFKEVMQALKGDISVFEKIPKRKENYLKALEMPPFPNVIVGRFEPEKWVLEEHRRSDYYRFGEASVIDTNCTVKGYAGASGRVEGIARVLTDISESDCIQAGDILVTTATNIGWVKVFPKLSAIVTDIGAPLSHAAIVARELGIPAVVGCGNATTVIRTGDHIRVDGTTGFVSFVKNE